MSDLSTKQLQALQIEADNAIDAILKSVAMSRRVQEKVRDIMQADGDAMGVFEQIAEDSRGQAHEILIAAIGVLVNLQTSRAAKAELTRRATGN